MPAATSSSSDSWRCEVDGGWTTIVWTLPSEAVSSVSAIASMMARPRLATAVHLDGEHPARDTGAGTGGRRHRAADGWGGRDRGRGARRPDARARPRVPRRSWHGARRGRRGSGCPRSTRNASNGPIVAPVSIWTSSTLRIRSTRPATTPAMTSLCPDEELRRRLDARGPHPARAGGRRTATRRCCRRCRSRRARGPCGRPSHGRSRRSSGWRWSRRRRPASGAAAMAAAAAALSVRSTKSTLTPNRAKVSTSCVRVEP